MTPSSEPQGLPESLSRARRDIEAWRRACVEERSRKRRRHGSRGPRDAYAGQRRDRPIPAQRKHAPSGAAISLVGLVCPRDQRFLPDAIRLAFEDPEPTVRGAGLAALWRLREHVASSGAALVGLLDELFAASPQNDAEAARFIAELRFARKGCGRRRGAMPRGARAPHGGKSRVYAIVSDAPGSGSSLRGDYCSPTTLGTQWRPIRALRGAVTARPRREGPRPRARVSIWPLCGHKRQARRRYRGADSRAMGRRPMKSASRRTARSSPFGVHFRRRPGRPQCRPSSFQRRWTGGWSNEFL